MTTQRRNRISNLANNLAEQIDELIEILQEEMDAYRNCSEEGKETRAGRASAEYIEILQENLTKIQNAAYDLESVATDMTYDMGND
ncbi:MAG: hypothetical protein Q4F09_05450 [Erysipelotrichaceae bacterium]|nr:hypothetical protein [Erysipelotrichaceae bacterium]